MTYAPANLVDLMAYLGEHGIVNSGIIGGPRHTYGYHLGRDRIFGPEGQGNQDYSIQVPRDKAGLTDGASAVDLGNGPELKPITAWLWEQCMAQAEGTSAIREILGSADGSTVRCFVGPDSGGPVMLDNCADASHLWHTHISFYRDTEGTDHRPLFRRYFEGEQNMQLEGSNVQSTANRRSTIVVSPVGNLMVHPKFEGGASVGQFPFGTELFPQWKVDGEDVRGNTKWYWTSAHVPGQGIFFGYISDAEVSALEVIENPPDSATPTPEPPPPDANVEAALLELNKLTVNLNDISRARTRAVANKNAAKAALGG